MSDIVQTLRSHLVSFATMDAATDRIEALEAEVERWHRVAMEAGAITCSDGRHIYPRRERIEQLEAALRKAIDDLERSIARAAIDQSSPPARQENDDVFKGFRSNNEA
jgi:multidrug resistance efflux pump